MLITFTNYLIVANKYEAVLAEQHGDGRLTEDRVVILFKVFDQILPKLGVYRAVFKLLRDHLFGKDSGITEGPMKCCY